MLVNTATRWRGVTGAAIRSPPWASATSLAVGLSDKLDGADDLSAGWWPTITRKLTAGTSVKAVLRPPQALGEESKSLGLHRGTWPI